MSPIFILNVGNAALSSWPGEGGECRANTSALESERWQVLIACA